MAATHFTDGGRAMWYFTWILGIGVALALAIINVMWLEVSYSFGELDETRIRQRFAGETDDRE
jgi:cytochrome bd-I ubiquinol oxidase subunit X